MLATGAEDGPELRPEQVSAAQHYSNAAPTELRIGLFANFDVRNGLVAADVQRADDERARTKRLGDRAICDELLLFARCGFAPQKQELGAQQADAFGATVQSFRCFVYTLQVGQHTDAMTITCRGGFVPLLLRGASVSKPTFAAIFDLSRFIGIW